ncbi:MAG TPA: hypothetical protein VGA37_11375 [Gemmatimonadales bacterium]
MYSTCLYCNRPLGANELVAVFPVGRRLAFDAAKGRLWVVCKQCERWNLTPLEERWEAFEECERLFRGARTRMSTDNVGLARLREGLELVRIGPALRPEFAAWRYGDQFGRRRKRALWWTAAGVAVTGALAAGAVAAGVGAGFIGQVPNLVMNIPVRARIRTADGRVLKVKHAHLAKAKIVPDPLGSGWSLFVKHSRGGESFHGEEAARVAGILLPQVNYMAGSPKVVRDAVDHIESAGDPEAFLEQIGQQVRWMGEYQVGRPALSSKKVGLIRYLPKDSRLAFEMALHEEQERVALAGELVDLELAWQAAEEIAKIADDMFVPSEHEAFIERHRPTGVKPEQTDPEEDA